MALNSLVPWVSRANHRPIAAMHREMNRVFDDFFRGFDRPLTLRGQPGWPRLEVCETDREFKVHAELPGLEERDVEITYADGIVTLRGEKRLEEATSLYSERWAGNFERQIALSDEVNADDVKATFRNGVLTVILGKKPEAQRHVKRIEIN